MSSSEADRNRESGAELSTLSPASGGASPNRTSGLSTATVASRSGTSPAGRSLASPGGSGQSGETSLTSYEKQAQAEKGLLGTGDSNDTPLRSDEAAISSGSTADQNVKRIVFGDGDPKNPYNFSNSRKWVITGTALLASFLVPMHGTAITVAAQAIDEEFNISDSPFPNGYWPIASWGLGAAVLIIVGLPIMEDLGIHRWFLITYALFFIFIIPQAVAQNFETLVITRFFTGAFGELPTSAVASIIPDLWDNGKDRSLPISLLNLGVMGGLTIAPAIYAPVIEYVHNWRWILYIQLIVYAALFPILWFGLQETRGAVILKQEANRIRKENPNMRVATDAENNAMGYRKILKAATTRPFYLLATEPVVLSISLWSAFSFGNVFLFTQSTEQVFENLYGWHFYSSGYILTAVFIGEVLGWAANGYGIYLYLESAKRNTETPNEPIPEARLYISIFGSFVGITGGMFVYGWTSYSDIPWIAPAIGLAMVGFGIQTVVNAACDYLEDSYADSDYAASAVSALAFLENIFGSFLPLACQSMYRNLGFHWASSLLGILALIISCGPVLFAWKGKSIRKRSKFMASGGDSAPGMTISGQQGKHDSTMS